MLGNPTLVYEGKERNVIQKTKRALLRETKRYGEQGGIERGWSNLLILGDCLNVLQTLRQDLVERPRLVYIDPPFSTDRAFRAGRTISSSERNEIAYEDKRVGAAFLEFLRQRLILLREILADDGSIYVHIDWKEGHYLKVLLDEVFGTEHFVNDIARIKCNPKNFERLAYGSQHDLILFYSKADDYVWNDPKIEMTEDEIKKVYTKVDEDGRRYMTTPLHAPGETKNGPTGQLWRGMNPPQGRHWRYSPQKLTELDDKGQIEWSSTRNPRKIRYADEHRHLKKMQDVWEFKDPQESDYPTQKNLEMLKKIVEASSHPGDIVLDSFSGSGTTLIAAEELSRRWIGIDNSEVAIKKSIDRLLRSDRIAPFTVYAEDECK